MTAVRTTCPYCGVGCGVLARADGAGGAAIAGDPDHPANFGRLCSKGSALGETLSLDDRLLHPVVRGVRATWDRALAEVARTFADTIRDHGPEAVAFYVSGQILTEDYYVANKLMKGFIGAANIDTNSRLCMSSSVAGHKRAFGTDTVPGTYEDLEQTDLVVLTGSNLAWCHPVLFQRLAAAKAARPGMRVVTIDPRRTATSELADLHLGLAPGSDVALFAGLLRRLAAAGRGDAAFIARHTSGLDAALAAAAAFDIGAVARVTGLGRGEIEQFYRLFAETERVVTVYSQGVNQSSAGTDKVNAIINAHLLTGRIGRPGMGPFSVTGQPNAMGGREVGGLANQLAAHLEIGDPAHRALVQDFWQSPQMPTQPGLKAVDLFEAVHDGRVKALWIMATNPAASLPDADRVTAALARCPFVVVSDVVQATDTSRYAHVLLPSTAWGEKDGTVTNSERRISRQRPFLPPPGETRHDWRQLAEVATRMGFPGFDWPDAAGVFREHAALSAHGNHGTRDFDIGAHAAIDRAGYDALAPFHWPQPAGEAPRARFFADGRFYTPDRKARFVATPYRAPAGRTGGARPLILNTGRVRDQWHTMTRTGKTARLTSHYAEPFVEINPLDARHLGLAAADLALVESDRGRALLRVLVTARQRPGSVFAPIHWTGQQASQSRIDALVAPHVDPVSGQPESKFTPVSLTRFAAGLYGFAVSRRRPAVEGLDYWALAPAAGGFRLELAALQAPADAAALLAAVLAPAAGAEVLAYRDVTRGIHRFAVFADGILDAALFLAAEPVETARGWLIGQLGQALDGAERLRLLAGRAGAGGADPGAIVCSCFSVGVNQIAAAVRGGACTVEAVGACLKAGTNCGSCRMEIGRLIDASRAAEAG
ncbi:nitrate reductase [Zavarzinia compransoris]|uniref:Nitrate reductase n=1 Tax=Zavarzinia compransoris TaxID=1264899 RepID=A0A317E7M1_9PROT|nr:nitrate reductase [Zavarzinia compransoris]PWR22270.1 nitrate reductase [Zavarzinia compransoris]TDP46968.1 assimilatory nitrate reductase (NADH) alpha subunit apoprotein [Zavarzinia compransoris]